MGQKKTVDEKSSKKSRDTVPLRCRFTVSIYGDMGGGASKMSPINGNLSELGSECSIY
jgi:hypothetical protein